MGIYLVTWKTAVEDGVNSEGSFVSECNIEDADSAIDQRDGWVEYVEQWNPLRKGGQVLITGAFKL